jgi:hypothetical protein
MERGGLFIIRTFSRDIDARLAEAVLDANGIESIIVGDNAAGMLPYLNALHPIRLAVNEADVEDAISLLDAGDVSGPPDTQ